MQDDGIIDMRNINIMVFSDEIIRINKQTGQIVPLRNIVRGPIEPTVPQLELWAVTDNGASDAFNMYEANDIWVQHGLDSRVNTCRRMIWQRRVGIFLDYKIAYSKDSKCTELLGWFSPADAMHTRYLSIQLRYTQPKESLTNTITDWMQWALLKLEKVRQ